MRAKVIILTLLATVSLADRAAALDELFKQRIYQQQWYREHRDDGRA